MYNFIGDNIAYYRKKKGNTQLQLADKIGISRASIGNIEKGRQGLSVDLLIKLCLHLDCTANDILSFIFKNTGDPENYIITDESLKNIIYSNDPCLCKENKL